ncbi:thioredoxin domain-containing protein 11 isoform X4 [Hydra vulgaris]|uniref:Thioredoxin domain-containing protein 11 isoform X4 n=1 Tax=Hydra vulgaris TaxID=6087 RepID=A0ABM4CDH2_HYDVU
MIKMHDSENKLLVNDEFKESKLVWSKIWIDCVMTCAMKCSYYTVPNFKSIYYTSKVIIMATSCIVCLVSLGWWLWLYSSFLISYKWKVDGLFPLNSSVVDIKDGSMHKLFKIVRNKPINMVIFYTPWSGASIASVKELSAASQFLTSPTVGFISINCWEGTCRKVFTSFYFPRIFLYHTSITPIEYLFEIDLFNIIDFIQSAVRPWLYIGNEQQLTSFLKSDNHVVSFMDKSFIENGNRYTAFFRASVRLINRVNKPKIGLITDPELAALAKLNFHGQICSSGFLRNRKCYPSSGVYTVDDIVHWVSVNIKQVVSELTPNATDASHYLDLLKQTPIALLAYSNGNLSTQFEDVASTYYNCSCPLKKKNFHKKKFSCKHNTCKTFFNQGNICTHCQFCYGVCECNLFMSYHIPVIQDSRNCLSYRISSYFFQDSYSVCCFKLSDNDFLSYTSTKLNDSYSQKEFSITFIKKLQNLNLQQAAFKLHLEAAYKKKLKNFKKHHLKNYNKHIKSWKCGSSAPCCNFKNSSSLAKSFKGLACNTNRTLSFYTMNYDKYKFILNNVGIHHTPSLLILDVLLEESFVSTNLSYNVIVDSIMNFTNGRLQQDFKSLDLEKEKLLQSGKVTELFSDSFEKFILQSTKNVFVMFYAAWCAICKTVNLQFLKLAHTYKRSDIVFARIDGDKNPLPWHYTSSRYPSFILFPQHRKVDSIHYGDDLDFSSQNFVMFLEKYLN